MHSPHVIHPPYQHCCQPRTLTLSQRAYTHATQTAVHASQSQQPPRSHRVPRQAHRQTKDDHMTTDTTQGHRHSSKNERNLTIMQVNINGIKNKLEELKLLIHDTHAYISTIQETKLARKANTPKVHNFTTVRADRLHKAGGGLITLIRDNITFTTTDIPSTINTHNTELQMVKIHINNTKHITIANIYISPRDSTSTHYKRADTDIQHCIQYITNIPHSVLTGDVNAHSTLWHSSTDDHKGQLLADVISNSDYITLNTNTPTRMPNTTLQQTSSPDITPVSNTLYNRTLWITQRALSSDHLPIITTINIRHDYRLQQNRRTFSNYKKADWTQFTEDTESAFAQTTIPTNIHTANIIFTNIILMAVKYNIPKGKMYSNFRLLLEDIVCKITQINNIRRANSCNPALTLLNEEITSDIQKHKQNIWKEHLDDHWDHRHNIHILWKTIHGLSNRAPPTTLNNSITFNNKITNTPKHIEKCFTKQLTNTVKHATHKQTDPLTEQHKTYKDTTSHSPHLRSKRQ